MGATLVQPDCRLNLLKICMYKNRIKYKKIGIFQIRKSFFANVSDTAPCFHVGYSVHVSALATAELLTGPRGCCISVFVPNVMLYECNSMKLHLCAAEATLVSGMYSGTPIIRL